MIEPSASVAKCKSPRSIPVAASVAGRGVATIVAALEPAAAEPAVQAVLLAYVRGGAAEISEAAAEALLPVSYHPAVQVAFRQLLTDPGVPIEVRAAVAAGIDPTDPEGRAGLLAGQPNPTNARSTAP